MAELMVSLYESMRLHVQWQQVEDEPRERARDLERREAAASR